MPLTQLHIREEPVADLTPLAGMPLESLRCQSTNVTDLTQTGASTLETGTSAMTVVGAKYKNDNPGSWRTILPALDCRT